MVFDKIGMLNNHTGWSSDYFIERIDLLRRTMPCHGLTSVRPVDFIERSSMDIKIEFSITHEYD
jgi:hypothetical protein